MTTPVLLEERITMLETRPDDRRDHVITPPKPHWYKRLINWGTARNLMCVVGGAAGPLRPDRRTSVRADEIGDPVRRHTLNVLSAHSHRCGAS